MVPQLIFPSVAHVIHPELGVGHLCSGLPAYTMQLLAKAHEYTGEPYIAYSD